MNKIKKSVQTELPFLSTVSQFKPVTGKSGDTRWYYVAKTYEQVMLILNDKGGWEWTPHDCLRGTPHLFGNRQQAQIIAMKFKHAVVETWLWSVPAPLKARK